MHQIRRNNQCNNHHLAMFSKVPDHIFIHIDSTNLDLCITEKTPICSSIPVIISDISVMFQKMKSKLKFHISFFNFSFKINPKE